MISAFIVAILHGLSPVPLVRTTSNSPRPYGRHFSQWYFEQLGVLTPSCKNLSSVFREAMTFAQTFTLVGASSAPGCGSSGIIPLPLELLAYSGTASTRYIRDNMLGSSHLA